MRLPASDLAEAALTLARASHGYEPTASLCVFGLRPRKCDVSAEHDKVNFSESRIVLMPLIDIPEHPVKKDSAIVIGMSFMPVG